MRHALHALAIAGLVAAALLALVGVASWPPGGPMFAAPYFFFGLAVVIGAASGVVLVLTRPRRPADRD